VTAGQATPPGMRDRRLMVVSIVVAVLGIIVTALVAIYVPEIRCALCAGPCGPAPFTLTMEDFTAACVEQYRDPRAVAEIARSDQELPSYWVKCFVDGSNLGGLSLDNYCPAGTRSFNPDRYAPEANEPWLKWQCARG
jgi:hypothetical protein